jgi:hypothetical protein
MDRSICLCPAIRLLDFFGCFGLADESSAAERRSASVEFR